MDPGARDHAEVVLDHNTALPNPVSDLGEWHKPSSTSPAKSIKQSKHTMLSEYTLICEMDMLHEIFYIE